MRLRQHGTLGARQRRHGGLSGSLGVVGRQTQHAIEHHARTDETMRSEIANELRPQLRSAAVEREHAGFRRRGHQRLQHLILTQRIERERRPPGVRRIEQTGEQRDLTEAFKAEQFEQARNVQEPARPFGCYVGAGPVANVVHHEDEARQPQWPMRRSGVVLRWTPPRKCQCSA
jgi:hypothetical protein